MLLWAQCGSSGDEELMMRYSALPKKTSRSYMPSYLTIDALRKLAIESGAMTSAEAAESSKQDLSKLGWSFIAYDLQQEHFVRILKGRNCKTAQSKPKSRQVQEPWLQARLGMTVSGNVCQKTYQCLRR